ncbi:hypothetical protein V7147_20175 [Bacillus sp. JJ1521]|uniref:hypothetical protein n=1 Tax=Bacillus sp. JJ1521 TaxID=3122957 RepID=UPI002FFF547E
MQRKNRKEEEQKELTFLGGIIVILLLVAGLFTSSIYGIIYLIAHAAIAFVGYVILDYYFGLGFIAVIMTLAVSIYLHLWLDGAFDKEEKVKKDELQDKEEEVKIK